MEADMRKHIGDLLNIDIPFLDSNKNKLLLIVFVSLYSFIFINVYAPYAIGEWGESRYWEFTLIGFLVLIFTHFVLRNSIGPKRFKLYSLLPWVFMEIMLMAFLFELAYSSTIPTFEEKITEYLVTFKQIGLVVVVPYALFLWYAHIKLKLSKYKEEIPITLDNGVSNEGNSELLILTGENNKVLLAIKYNQLLYIKSAGNYLELFYLKGTKCCRELVRMSFKELDAILKDQKVIRIHRSYMVNTAHINALKKTKKGYTLSVEYIPEEKIPVSYGYKASFEKVLQLKTMPR